MEWSGVEVYQVAEGKGGDVDCVKDLDSPVSLSLSEAGLRLSRGGEGKAKAAERLWTLASISAQALTERSVSVRVEGAGGGAFLFAFASSVEATAFLKGLSPLKPASLVKAPKSVFDSRTDEASAQQYFQFYGYLSQQQNMLQDYVRTATYQQAILSNLCDFKGKVVLDVGAGSGILSFFAAQAGAAKVYAVEASTMAVHASDLVKANGLQSVIQLVPGKIEEVTIPEMVDVIISEPMGYMLLNERMLETYLHAKKFLKPGGKMFPSRGDLHIAPFTDEALYLEQTGKAAFWAQESFHGVNLSSLRPHALAEYFKQPVVDTFHVAILSAPSLKWSLDFINTEEAGLIDIDIPLSFTATSTGHIHGLAFWFDVAFIGGVQTVWLSTGPTEALTHWYQVRCLFPRPLLAKQGDVLNGRCQLVANARQSYDVHIQLEGEGGVTVENSLDLKNPFFRYGGQVLAPPPGSQPSETSPTDAYWAQAQASAQASTSGPYGGAIPATSFIPQPAQAQAQASAPSPNANSNLAPNSNPSVTVTANPVGRSLLDGVVSGGGVVRSRLDVDASIWGPPTATPPTFSASSNNSGTTMAFRLPTTASASPAPPSATTTKASVVEMIYEQQQRAGPNWQRRLTEEAETGAMAMAILGSGSLSTHPLHSSTIPKPNPSPLPPPPQPPLPLPTPKPSLLDPFPPISISTATAKMKLSTGTSQAMGTAASVLHPYSSLSPPPPTLPSPNLVNPQPQLPTSPLAALHRSALLPPTSPFLPTRQARLGGVPMLGLMGGGSGEPESSAFPAALASHALGSLASSIGNGFHHQNSS